ncbi:hypothetical protein Fot_15397 [Forsythia ovata]|uniref:Uncharacterized protein n=1 Tax=Forsythia ovata TaxID=205694 RepID=A0ABD1W921_9LAMI
MISSGLCPKGIDTLCHSSTIGYRYPLHQKYLEKNTLKHPPKPSKEPHLSSHFSAYFIPIFSTLYPPSNPLKISAKLPPNSLQKTTPICHLTLKKLPFCCP